MILTDVYIPAVNENYDFMLDENVPALQVMEEISEMISKKVIDSGELKNCRLSLCELEEIKKVLVEEEMYYEFLR